MFVSLANFSFKFSHPLILGMGLLLILISVVGLMVFYGVLHSFCLFMVMVGGVLVVFSYTISLVPYLGGEFKFGVPKSSEYVKVSKFGACVGVVLLVSLMVVFSMDSCWDAFSVFSESMYYSNDWGVAVVWLSLLLFLVMVFSVSVAGKYTGALLK